MSSVSEQVVNDLLWYPLKHWCRAYFDTVCKNFTCENNFTESFNKWILIARGKPIIKMLKDIIIKIQRRAKVLQDVPLSAPQPNEESVFMSTPGFVASYSQQISQPMVEAAAPSRALVQKPVAPLRALVDEYESEDEFEGEDEQPLLRPRALSEAKTRLKIKKLQQKPTGTRNVNFRGDDNGVSMPTNLPYLPKR